MQMKGMQSVLKRVLKSTAKIIKCLGGCFFFVVSFSVFSNDLELRARSPALNKITQHKNTAQNDKMTKKYRKIKYEVFGAD